MVGGSFSRDLPYSLLVLEHGSGVGASSTVVDGGIISLTINYLLTLVLTVMVIKIVQHNQFFNRLLYMK